MPDGFDPHTELDRIYTLRDVMIACRQRAPKIIRMIDEMLDDDTVEVTSKIKLFDMVLNRGYGKPRQQISISTGDHTDTYRSSAVKIIMPDNGRQPLPTGPVIDARQED